MPHSSSSSPPPWTNRIVRYSDEAPDQLLANPRNFRTHPDRQAAALRGILTNVGVVQNVIANVRTGHLIDGHLRVMEALKAGQPTIPVTWIDVSDDEEVLILATLDPLAALAGTDSAQLDAILRDVATRDAAVQQMLDDLAVKAGLVDGLDVDELWKGMPEFEHEDKLAYKSLTVHFKDQDAVDAFAARVGQPITERTRFLWYPTIEIETYADKRYAPES